MPYKQVFHNNSELNNKFFDLKEGEGIFDFIKPAFDFVKNNSELIKDGISSGAHLIGGVKDIVNTVDSHNKAQKEIEAYKEIINLQKELRNKKISEKKVSQDQKPITFTANPKTEIQQSANSSLSNEQLAAIRNAAKNGEGLRIFK